MTTIAPNTITYRSNFPSIMGERYVIWSPIKTDGIYEVHVWDYGYENEPAAGRPAMDLLAGYARRERITIGEWHTFYGYNAAKGSSLGRDADTSQTSRSVENALYTVCERLAVNAAR